MAKVIDLTNSDGDLVVLGRAIVLPNSTSDTQPNPFNGSIRFNPLLGAVQFFHAGAWITLGEGSGGGSAGDGSSNNHTHSISQIVGLQNILNNKAPLIHNHTYADITGLSDALAGKANLTHTHTVSEIVELQALLDSKALKVHSHEFAIPDTISASFPATPPANYKLIYTAAIGLTFPANFDGSFVNMLTPPAAMYTITLMKNLLANVGSLIFYPNGNIVKNLPAGLTLAPGDTLTFQCPARDTTLNTISFTLKGMRPAQTTS